MGTNTASVTHRESLPAGVIRTAFARALFCASEFEGATSPNPPVGCVLLDASGNVLAAAAHRRAGEPHAEALAIELSRRNGTLERIHTVVATLEPCNHTGRTPPCTEAILATPAKHLWIGARDPNPTVRGGGSDGLVAAGLTVNFIEDLGLPEAGALSAAATRLIAPFAKRARAGLPWMTVKQALNRVGGMVPPAGQKTFTSEASLAFAHQLRKRADAVLTGSGTVLADAPEFTVRRVPDFPGKRRHLVILDRRGRVPKAYLDAARDRGFDAWLGASLAEELQRLGEAGVLELLVEAGPELTRTILDSELWDEHVLIQQGPEPAGADQIIIRRRSDPTTAAGKEDSVYRHR